jgi:hypothetical protein
MPRKTNKCRVNQIMTGHRMSPQNKQSNTTMKNRQLMRKEEASQNHGMFGLLRPGRILIVKGDRNRRPTVDLTFACIEDRRQFLKWYKTYS